MFSPVSKQMLYLLYMMLIYSFLRILLFAMRYLLLLWLILVCIFIIQSM